VDAEPAAAGRYFHFSGAPELAPTADRAVDLPVHADLPRGRSDFVAWNGQTIVVDDADKAADALSNVFVL
jgi:hypothetical protein